ncbi:hypothetical protein MTO96_043836 [Rhipicephalus appendiculatus]
MECVVEGHTISEEGWSDDSWQLPAIMPRNDADGNFKTKASPFFNRVRWRMSAPLCRNANPRLSHVRLAYVGGHHFPDCHKTPSI